MSLSLGYFGISGGYSQSDSEKSSGSYSEKSFKDFQQTEQYKQSLEYFQRGLDELQQSFKGERKTLSGIALDQDSLKRSSGQLEGEYKQSQFVTDRYRYDWPLLPVRNAVNVSDWQQQMEARYRQVTESEQELSKEVAELAGRLETAQRNAKDLDQQVQALRQELDKLQQQAKQLPQDKLRQQVDELLQKVKSLESDLASTPERTFKGHTADVNGVAVSADGRSVVSGGGDQTVRVKRLLPAELAPSSPR